MPCQHGNEGSCPHDRLYQMRLRWTFGIDPRGPQEDWQTHTGMACEADMSTLYAQVGPLLRARGYQTRTITTGEHDAGCNLDNSEVT
jgi:hypothetical protein